MYFVDFEASSLQPGGYPIEIGWCSVTGFGTSHLIRPHPTWLAKGVWDTCLEAAHGISLDTLMKHGQPIEYVAAAAVAVLDRQHVYSEAPAYDGSLLEDLLYFGGCPEMIHLLPVQEAYSQVCRPLLDCAADSRERGFAFKMCRRFVSQAEREEEALRKKRHRAFEGALASWRTWRRVRWQVDGWS